MTLFYTFSSKLRFIYFDIKNSYSKDDKYLAVIKESGLWIKDEIDNKILIINAEKIDKNFLTNVSIHEFDNNFQLINLIQSKKVDISKYEWNAAKPLIFNNNSSVKLDKEYLIETHFNIEKINSLFRNLSSLDYFQLIKLKNDYASLGNSTREIVIHLHKLYSLPLFLSIMTVIVFNSNV